jgi:hypothetical protein
MSKSTRILLVMSALMVLGNATIMNAVADVNPYKKACEAKGGKYICDTNTYTGLLNCSCEYGKNE